MCLRCALLQSGTDVFKTMGSLLVLWRYYWRSSVLLLCAVCITKYFCDTNLQLTACVRVCLMQVAHRLLTMQYWWLAQSWHPDSFLYSLQVYWSRCIHLLSVHIRTTWLTVNCLVSIETAYIIHTVYNCMATSWIQSVSSFGVCL